MLQKLVIIGAEIIAEPLTLTITCRWDQEVFLDKTKITFAIALNKGKANKYDFSNYRSLGNINRFYRIHEKVIKVMKTNKCLFWIFIFVILNQLPEPLFEF